MEAGLRQNKHNCAWVVEVPNGYARGEKGGTGRVAVDDSKNITDHNGRWANQMAKGGEKRGGRRGKEGGGKEGIRGGGGREKETGTMEESLAQPRAPNRAT